MVEEYLGLKDQVVSRESPGRNPNQAHLHNAERSRGRNLAEVKPECSRDIEVRVDVMHVMKSPEKRHAMVRDMPVIKPQVHEEKAQRKLRPDRQYDEMDQTERLVG